MITANGRAIERGHCHLRISRTTCNPIKKSIPYGRNTLTLETGEIARQAGGAVHGQPRRHRRAGHRRRAPSRPRPGQDFFPLTVDYQEKTYAAGQDPRRLLQARGPAVREGDADLAPDRPPDPAAVSRTASTTKCRSSRRCCRSIPEIDPDIPAMIGASAALTLSGVPFNGPIGAARVGYIDGQYVLNPTKTELTTLAARSGRRRHRSRRADGRVGSQRTARRSDARRGGVRPPAAAGGDRRRSTSWSKKPASRCGTGRRPPKDEAMIAKVTALAEAAAARGVSAAPEAGAPAAPEGDRRQGRGRMHSGRCARRATRTRSTISCSSSKRRSCATRSCPASRASTAATRAPCARSRSAPACCRARTARRCSRAARRRRWSSPRSAPRATSRSSTR